MDKQLLIQQKQNLTSLESNEKKLALQLKSKKRNRNIGIVIAIIGVVTLFIIIFGNIDFFPVLFLSFIGGIIGIVMSILFGRATAKAVKSHGLIISEIEEVKMKIIETENS